jgi:hypothetical protein
VASRLSRGSIRGAGGPLRMGGGAGLRLILIMMGFVLIMGR